MRAPRRPPSRQLPLTSLNPRTFHHEQGKGTGPRFMKVPADLILKYDVTGYVAGQGAGEQIAQGASFVGVVDTADLPDRAVKQMIGPTDDNLGYNHIGGSIFVQGFQAILDQDATTDAERLATVRAQLQNPRAGDQGVAYAGLSRTGWNAYAEARRKAAAEAEEE